MTESKAFDSEYPRNTSAKASIPAFEKMWKNVFNTLKDQGATISSDLLYHTPLTQSPPIT